MAHMDRHDVRIYVVRDEKYFSEFRGKSVSSFLTARDGTRNFRLNGEGSVHPCWTSWRTPFTCSGHQRVKAQLRKVRSQSNQAVPKSSHPTHLCSRGSGFCLEVQRAWWTTCRPLLGVWEGRVIVGPSNNVENLHKVTIFMIELARQ